MKALWMLLPVAVLVTGCGDSQKNSWERVALPQGYSDSHILSIDIRDGGILLGTFGSGAIFSADGESWAVYDTGSGLSWNFIMGGDWLDDYVILATLGDGLNISEDGGKSWERYGYNYFGIEHLYSVAARIQNGMKYVPTADGLVVFDSIGDWSAVTEKDGLASQYIYDIKIRGDIIALGTLHGLSISVDRGENWSNHSPNGRHTRDDLPAGKVRAVEFAGDNLFAGCDDGLFYSQDNGAKWENLSHPSMRSPYVHDLALDRDGKLWIATFEEIVVLNPETFEWRMFDSARGLPARGINCVGVNPDGFVLAGTNEGLFRLARGVPVPPVVMPVDAEFTATEEPVHQWMLRPVRPDDQNLKDQTYLYGSTMGGNFRQHQGNEYNAPEGTPLLAVDDGTIVYIDKEIGHSVLKCDRKQGDFFVYAHYHHQFDILRKAGEIVKRGEVIGEVGEKGNVTNEHLHFEISLSLLDDSNKESHTRNPELWIEPLAGTGTIVGLLVDNGDKPVQGARIYGVTKPIPTESPFSFAETYKDSVHSDESYNENFVIGDVLPGEYTLYSDHEGKNCAAKVAVEAGKVTRVQMKLR
jgi:hypothetical protein